MEGNDVIGLSVHSLHTAPPWAPLDFSIVALGPRNITFSWVTGNPGADHVDSGPDLERQEDLHNAPNGYVISCTPQPIAFPYTLNIAANTTSCAVRRTLGGFEPGTDYSCYLRAYNGAGMGQEATATATTPGSRCALCILTLSFKSQRLQICVIQSETTNMCAQRLQMYVLHEAVHAVNVIDNRFMA